MKAKLSNYETRSKMILILFTLFGCDARIGIYETTLNDAEFGPNEEEIDLCDPFFIYDYSCEDIESFAYDGRFSFRGYDCILEGSDFTCTPKTETLSTDVSDVTVTQTLNMTGTFSEGSSISYKINFTVQQTVECDGENCAEFALNVPCEDTISGYAYKYEETLGLTLPDGTECYSITN